MISKSYNGLEHICLHNRELPAMAVVEQSAFRGAMFNALREIKSEDLTALDVSVVYFFQALAFNVKVRQQTPLPLPAPDMTITELAAIYNAYYADDAPADYIQFLNDLVRSPHDDADPNA